MLFWLVFAVFCLPIVLWAFFTVLTVYFGPIVPIVLLALLGCWLYRMFRKARRSA